MERRGKQSSEPLRVAIVIFPGFQTLDALGPLEVFATAGELAARSGAAATNGSAYRVELWAERAGPVCAWTGVEFVAQRAYPRARVSVDTLLLAGGGQLGQPRVRPARGLLRFLRRSAGEVRRIGSVCTGLRAGRCGPAARAPCHHALAIRRRVVPAIHRRGGRAGRALRA